MSHPAAVTARSAATPGFRDSPSDACGRPVDAHVMAFAADAENAMREKYADGRPFDELHYLQAKLLLKPDRFSSPDRFHDLGTLVQRTARSMSVASIDEPDAGQPPRIREIVFGDTPGVSQVRAGDRRAMSTVARIIPALADLKKSRDERIHFVNEGIVEELLFPLARLDVGKGIVAKSNVALWRTSGDHQPIVGEYSFQLKFDRREDIPGRTEKLVKHFFITLQQDLDEWISLGTTKTGMVYRLKGHAVERHE